MQPPTSANQKLFLAAARIHQASLIPVFFVYEARNEWVDWNGNTDVRSTPIGGGPLFSIAEAMEMAEKRRKPGSVFRIKGTLGILLSCNGGAAVLSQHMGQHPFKEVQKLAGRLKDRSSLSELHQRLPYVHGLAISLFLGKDADLATDPLEDNGTVYDRTSTAGGSRNGLGWSLSASKVDWVRARGVANLLNTTHVPAPAGETSPDLASSEVTTVPAAAIRAHVGQATDLERTEPRERGSAALANPTAVPSTLEETQRITTVTGRVGQDLYRDALLDRWKGCSVTGCQLESVLIASHIKPWILGETAQERLDVANGLLLVPNLDRLFDKGLISFDDSFRVLLSTSLRAADQVALGVSRDMKLTSAEHHDLLPYLAWHRENVFQA